MANGSYNLTSDKARILSTQPGADKFWRGDNSWSDTFDGVLLLPQGLKTGARVNDTGSGIEITDDGGIEIFHTSTPFIDFHYQASTADYSVRLICDSATSLKCTSAFAANGSITADGGYLYAITNGNTVQIGSQNGSCAHFTNTKDIPFWFNKVIYSDGGFNIYNTGDNVWRNGYLKVNKSDGGDCYIELRRQGNADWRILNSGGNLYFQNNWTSAKGSYFNVLQLDYNTGKVHVLKGRFYVPEWIEFSCAVGGGGLYCPNANGAHWYPNNASSYGTWAIQGSRGGYTGIHLGPNKQYMTIMGGECHNGLYCENRGRWIIYYTEDSDRIALNGSSINTNVGCYMNGSMGASGEFIGNSSQGFRLINNNRGVLWHWNGSTPQFYLMFTDGGNPYGSWNSARPFYVNTSNYYSYFVRAYNAVWNDFAEFRTGETEEGGWVVYDNESGIMKKTTKRLQAAARITSDTFGCAVGQSDTAKTPIGVGGRVLAYTYQNRNNYKIGDAVCSAPGGTVDIMTRDEIIMYPDRIIGIVSEIPNYEVWNSTLSTGDGGANSVSVEVKDRIWIYVK